MDLEESLPIEFTREVELVPFQCAVVSKAMCGKLVKLLGAFSEDLKHLKRVRPQGEQLAVLLSSKELSEELSEELQSFLREQNVSPITVQVPRHCPFTSEQLESFQRHWPVKKLVSSFQPLELTQEHHSHARRDFMHRNHE